MAFDVSRHCIPSSQRRFRRRGWIGCIRCSTGYASKIQGVVEKSGGKFLVRGGDVSYAEGDKAGLNVIVEFPDVAAAHAWLESDAYKEITSARSDNSSGQFMIVEGV